MAGKTGVDAGSTPGVTVADQLSPTDVQADTAPGGDPAVQDGVVADVTPDAVVPDAPQVDLEVLEAQLEEQKNIQKGLDRSNTRFQAQAERSKARIVELEEQLAQHQTVVQTDATVLEEYESQLQQAAVERDNWQQQAEEAITRAERQKIIVDEFPDLTWLIAGNAVPQGVDDDTFRASLTNIRERVPASQTSAPPAAPPSSPPRTPSGAAVNLDEVQRAMLDASNRGDDVEFAKQKAIWDSIAPDELENVHG